MGQESYGKFHFFFFLIEPFPYQNIIIIGHITSDLGCYRELLLTASTNLQVQYAVRSALQCRFQNWCWNIIFVKKYRSYDQKTEVDLKLKLLIFLSLKQAYLWPFIPLSVLTKLLGCYTKSNLCY